MYPYGSALVMVGATVAGLLVGACANEGRGASDVATGCRVTLPNEQEPYEGAGVNHRVGRMWVSLWQDGIVRAKPGDVNPDGSIDAKFGWWRGVSGDLQITGKRLDRRSLRRPRAHIPSGYGESRFQPSTITFPAPACWRITGRVGRAKLTFITRVLIE